MPRILPRPSRRPAIARAYPGITLVAPFLGPGKAVGSDGGDVRVIGSAGDATGTRVGGCTFGDGPIGKQINCDGSSGYASIPNTTAQILGGSGAKITIEAWVNWTSSTEAYNSVLSKEDSTINNGYTLLLKSNQKIAVYLSKSSGGGSTSQDGLGSTVPFGQPVHIAATYDGNVISTYINGALNAANTVGSFTWDTPVTAMRIGSSVFGSGRYFKGSIMGTAISPFAKIAAQIASDYALGRATLLAPSSDGYYDAGLIRNYARGLLTLDCGN